MESNPQEHLALTLENKSGNVLEFIRHQDHNYWIYYNGVLTDARYPRHEKFHKNMKRIKIYNNIWYGQSKYNRKKLRRFFMELIPEHFL